MYLVMLQHDMDDLPVAAFENHSDAMQFARDLEPYPTEEMRDVFHTDCSTPNLISIVEFIARDVTRPLGRGKWVPVMREMVRSLSDIPLKSEHTT